MESETDHYTPPRFGYPLERRKKELDACLRQSPIAHHLQQVKGEIISLPIVRVPIELPKYRLSNGRTASLQQEWLSNNAQAPEDYFERDPEWLDAQMTQHELLERLVESQGLLKYFRDGAKQIQPILLDEHGFVVNGNRRLCAWRMLHYTAKDEYPHFSHVNVVVLPHCDDKEIDRIEAELQIKQDIRADYTWETQAIMMRQKQRLHGFTEVEIAELYEMPKRQVEELWGMLDLAGEYLRSRDLENRWSRVRKDEYGFRQLYKTLKKEPTASKREFCKHIAFAFIDNPEEAGGRLYSEIPKIQQHLSKVQAKLEEAFDINGSTPDPGTEDFFGGDTPAAEPDTYLPLTAEITKEENWPTVRELVAEAISSENALRRERENARFLRKMLSDANAKMQSAVSSGLRHDSESDGIEAQLAQIEEKVAQIREWLKNRDA